MNIDTLKRLRTDTQQWQPMAEMKCDAYEPERLREAAVFAECLGFDATPLIDLLHKPADVPAAYAAAVRLLDMLIVKAEARQTTTAAPAAAPAKGRQQTKIVRKRLTIADWLDILEEYEIEKAENPDLDEAKFARSKELSESNTRKMLARARAERFNRRQEAKKIRERE